MRRLSLYLFLCCILAGCAGTASAHQGPVMELPALPVLPTLTQSNLPTAISTPSPVITPMPAGDKPFAEASPSPTPSPYVFGPVSFPANVNPLTGLPVSETSLLDRRPMAIKVTNFPRSVRPQWGLSKADQVFEYYIGDQMSRFIGIFYGEDASQVGPIRSARLFDEQIMRMYNAIFVFGWADDPILDHLLQPDLLHHLVVENPDNCPPLCRLKSGHGYNNLFTDTHLLSQYVSDRGTDNERQDLNGLLFELAAPKSGNLGEKFLIRYSIVSYHYWQYDLSSGRYLRFQETVNEGVLKIPYAPLTDNLTGKQLSADNVIILRMPHEIYYQSSSTTIIQVPFIGQGDGYAFRDGQVYPIRWSHPELNRLPSITLPNGYPYPLKPGNTWFEVLGETSPLLPQADGSYRFEFSIP